MTEKLIAAEAKCAKLERNAQDDGAIIESLWSDDELLGKRVSSAKTHVKELEDGYSDFEQKFSDRQKMSEDGYELFQRMVIDYCESVRRSFGCVYANIGAELLPVGNGDDMLDACHYLIWLEKEAGSLPRIISITNGGCCHRRPSEYA